jgi:type I restriction enzyme S subunit
MELKPRYKLTEVGVIPEDWKLTRVESVFSLKHGFAFSSDYFCKSGPIVLTPGNFRLEGGLYFEERNTKHYCGKYAPNMTFSRGDLLIVMTDLTPDCNLLGKPAFVESDEVILHNQRIGKVVLKDNNVDVRFLFYVLLSRLYLDRIKEQATGSTVRHTSNKSIYDVQLALPPLLEQRSIATTLSDMDELLGACDRLIAKKRNLKQATMQQLLTGKTRLPGFGEGKGYKETEVGIIPEDWESVKLESLISEISMGPFGSDIKVSNFISEGIPVLSGANIQTDKLDDKFINFVTPEKARNLKKAVAQRGDVVVTHRGTLGQISYIPNDSKFDRYVISQSQFRVRFSILRVMPHWVVLYFLSENGAEKLLERKGHTGVPAIAQPTTTFRNLIIPLPPLNEQTAIATVLSDMDAEIAALEQRRDKTLALKQAMMQALLTGRIRLV